jgi:transposase-like protein
MSKQSRRYSGKFKQAALKRMEECADVSALAKELGIRRKFLYLWRDQFKQGGLAALSRPPGRPRQRGGIGEGQAAVPSAEQVRIAELEQLLGRKQLEVDFLKRAFEQVRGAALKAAGDGGKRSMESSRPRSRSKE